MITKQNFKRIDNNVNGNPRYVIHFLNLITDKESENLKVEEKYSFAANKARKLGGKKYHTRAYGGGIVFCTYNLNDLCKELNALVYGKES